MDSPDLVRQRRGLRRARRRLRVLGGRARRVGGRRRLAAPAVQERHSERRGGGGQRDDGEREHPAQAATSPRLPAPLSEAFVRVEGLEQHRGSGTVFPPRPFASTARNTFCCVESAMPVRRAQGGGLTDFARSALPSLGSAPRWRWTRGQGIDRQAEPRPARAAMSSCCLYGPRRERLSVTRTCGTGADRLIAGAGGLRARRSALADPLPLFPGTARAGGALVPAVRGRRHDRPYGCCTSPRTPCRAAAPSARRRLRLPLALAASSSGRPLSPGRALSRLRPPRHASGRAPGGRSRSTPARGRRVAGGRRSSPWANVTSSTALPSSRDIDDPRDEFGDPPPSRHASIVLSPDESGTKPISQFV